MPPDAPHGKDSPVPPPPAISWDDQSVVIPIHPTLAPNDDGSAASEGAEDTSDPSPTWHDVALSIAAELMAKIRKDIYAKLGYTTSAVSACDFSRPPSSLCVPRRV